MPRISQNHTGTSTAANTAAPAMRNKHSFRDNITDPCNRNSNASVPVEAAAQIAPSPITMCARRI
jgi:hypothetical protein